MPKIIPSVLPMPITTPRLFMRPPMSNDCEIVNAAVLESFESLHSFMPWAEKPPSLSETEEFINAGIANWQSLTNNDVGLPILLFEKGSCDFVGATGFHHINVHTKQVEVGYWIRHKYSGKGLMLEAINVLTQYAFIQFGMKNVGIHCNEANFRSIKIPRQLGYHLEMVLREKSINRIDNMMNNMLIFTRKNLHGLSTMDYTVSESDSRIIKLAPI